MGPESTPMPLLVSNSGSETPSPPPLEVPTSALEVTNCNGLPLLLPPISLIAPSSSTCPTTRPTRPRPKELSALMVIVSTRVTNSPSTTDPVNQTPPPPINAEPRSSSSSVPQPSLPDPSPSPPPSPSECDYRRENNNAAAMPRADRRQ